MERARIADAPTAQAVDHVVDGLLRTNEYLKSRVDELEGRILNLIKQKGEIEAENKALKKFGGAS